MVIIWTPEQVSMLWARQMNSHTHPYTCCNRGDGAHRPIGSDLGMLIPTVFGWICPFCAYTQNWSHETKEPK